MNNEMMMMFMVLALDRGRRRSNAADAYLASSGQFPAPGRLLWAMKTSDDKDRARDRDQLAVGTEVKALLDEGALNPARLQDMPSLHAAYHRVAPHDAIGHQDD